MKSMRPHFYRAGGGEGEHSPLAPESATGINQKKYQRYRPQQPRVTEAFLLMY